MDSPEYSGHSVKKELKDLIGDFKIAPPSFSNQQNLDRELGTWTVELNQEMFQNNFEFNLLTPPCEIWNDLEVLEAESIEAFNLIFSEQQYQQGISILETLVQSPLIRWKQFDHVFHWLGSGYEMTNRPEEAVEMYIKNRQFYCNNCPGATLGIAGVNLFDLDKANTAAQFLDQCYEEILWRVNFMLAEANMSFAITDTDFVLLNTKEKLSFCVNFQEFSQDIRDKFVWNSSSPLNQLTVSVVSFLRYYHQ